MAKTKQQKEELLSQLEGLIDDAKSAVFVTNNGINAEDTVSMRQKLFKQGSKYIVPKKTILKIALQNKKIDVEGVEFTGAINAVFNLEDELEGIKTVYDLAKDSDALEVVAGIFENKLVDKNVVTKLASMPSRDELRAKMVGSLNAPISGFVNSLAGNLRNLVGVLNAIKESKA